MYYNEKHNKRVIDRGDNYTYIGSYKTKEITIDGKKSKPHIRVKCPYCGEEYDIALGHFTNRNDKCKHCCNTYENSFAYYIQQELKEPLNKYWDWEKNDLNPYLIYKQTHNFVNLKCDKIDYHGDYNITPHNFINGNRCSYCHGDKVHPKDSFAQWGIDAFGEDFLDKYWNWNKNNELGIDP